jgi:hypothetical protein
MLMKHLRASEALHLDCLVMAECEYSFKIAQYCGKALQDEPVQWMRDATP